MSKKIRAMTEKSLTLHKRET